LSFLSTSGAQGGELALQTAFLDSSCQVDALDVRQLASQPAVLSIRLSKALG
jgi:hypothetical protein